MANSANNNNGGVSLLLWLVTGAFSTQAWRHSKAQIPTLLAPSKLVSAEQSPISVMIQTVSGAHCETDVAHIIHAENKACAASLSPADQRTVFPFLLRLQPVSRAWENQYCEIIHSDSLHTPTFYSFITSMATSFFFFIYLNTCDSGRWPSSRRSVNNGRHW